MQDRELQAAFGDRRLKLLCRFALAGSNSDQMKLGMRHLEFIQIAVIADTVRAHTGPEQNNGTPLALEKRLQSAMPVAEKRQTKFRHGSADFLLRWSDLSH